MWVFVLVAFALADDPVPPDVAALIHALDAPATRLKAIEGLLEPGKLPRPELSVSSDHPNPMPPVRKLALDAIAQHEDDATVRRALTSRRPVLRCWALGVLFRREEDALTPWLPLLHEAALDPHDSVRANAVYIFLQRLDHGEFLNELERRETNPEILFRLVDTHHWEPREYYDQEMNAAYERLLDHESQDVRDETLRYLGFQSHRAPMFQFEIGDGLRARMIAATCAPAATERVAAVYALGDLEDLPEEVAIEVGFALARDESTEVRWRVASMLRPWVDAPLARMLLQVLTTDQEATVRIFAHSALGMSTDEPLDWH